MQLQGKRGPGCHLLEYCVLNESNVQTLHQAELLKDARAVLEDEFSIVTRPSVESLMPVLKVDVLDVIHALQKCNKVTMNFANLPCAEYHGTTQDGECLVVVAVIHPKEKIVKIVKLWKE